MNYLFTVMGFPFRRWRDSAGNALPVPHTQCQENHLQLYAIAALLALFALSCGQNSPESDAAGPGERQLESPDIQIQIQGTPAGTAYLIGSFADQNYRADSAQIDAAGAFRFQREEPYKPGLYYAFYSNNGAFQVMIDADQTFSMAANAADVVGSMQVSGSLDNELLYKNLQYEAMMQPRFQAAAQKMQGAAVGSPAYLQAKAEQDELIAQRKAHLREIFDSHPDAFFTKFKTAGQNPDVHDIRKPDGTEDTTAQVYRYRTEFWDNVDFSDERLLSTPVIFNKLKRYMNDLTPQHPDSINKAASFLVDKVLDYPEYFKFFANWIVLQYEPTKTTLMDPEAVFVHMAQNYFTYDRAFWSDSAEIYAIQLRANEMAGSLVGHKAPDVQAQGPDGKTYAISAIKSPYVIVYMFNPDCEHCQEQSPQLVQFYRQWKNQGVEVFGIGVDTNMEDWKAYLKKTGMDAWPNVFDATNKAIYGKYYVDITPEIYVLNPERTIIAKNLKVNQIAEVIERDRRGR